MVDVAVAGSTRPDSGHSGLVSSAKTANDLAQIPRLAFPRYQTYFSITNHTFQFIIAQRAPNFISQLFKLGNFTQAHQARLHPC